jgi:hypothetical protein
MDKPGAQDFKDFVLAFGHSWASLATGALSFPLAIAGVLWDGSSWLKTLFLVTAAACLVFASFWVWWPEHLKALATEPRLELLVASDVGRFVERGWHASWGAGSSHVGVCVRNTGNLRTSNCEVFFDDIAPDEGEVTKGGSLVKPFVLNGSAEKIIPLVSFEKREGVTMGDLYLNFDPDGGLIQRTFDASQASKGYTITLRATAAECGPTVRKFRFWVNNTTMKMERRG